MNWKRLMGLIFSLVPALSLSADDGAGREMILGNRQMNLSFDSTTGAWVGFQDATTGEELIVPPASPALVLSTPTPKIDLAQIHKALTAGRGLDLTVADWLYTPKPPTPSEGESIIQGKMDSVHWDKTPVPSRRGAGDDLLHDRLGDFFYRHELSIPESWPDEDLTLEIGAVDDTDVTYFNGDWIGATGVETPRNWEAPRYYRIPRSLVRHDRPNVLLIKATNGGFDGGLFGPVVIGLASDLVPQSVAYAALNDHQRIHRDHMAVLQLVAVSPPYEYQMEYALYDDEPLLTRQWTVRNIADKEVVLQREPAYLTPPLVAGPDQVVIFPGSVPVGDHKIARLRDGESLGPRSQEPLAVLYDQTKSRGLGTWFHSEEEFAPVSVRRVGKGTVVRHAQQIIKRLKPGESVTLGKQYLWLVHGSRQESIEGVQQVYRQIGLRPPPSRLANLREMVLYCGHPGGTPEQNFRGYGGFTALERYAPTLKAMNIDLVWLLPIWEHGDGSKWNLYSPFDHFQVSPIYGTPDELKRLSKTLEDNHIRLMFDLVPHGPPDFSPLAKEHPEWITLGEDGKRHYEWGQYAFDNAHPGWQDYFRRVAEFDGRQFGAIGARVDCGAGSAPNWNREVTDRPSLSTLAAGLGMNRAIREGFLQSSREVVILPEEYTGANIFYRVADLTYDEQLYFLLMDLNERKASPEEWADLLQRFLQDQRASLPAGAIKMRWISNHDTVTWTFQKNRPLKVYGVEKMRALQALNAFIEGVPMLYQGDDDPAVYGAKGPSSVEVLARYYALRKQMPALRSGDADYEAVRASGGVFACLRRASGQTALVLISLSERSLETDLSSENDLQGTWRDAVSDEQVMLGSTKRLTMSPYQVRVLVH